MESLVLIDRDDGITTVTLNRPEALNAMSQELRRELERAFRQLQEDRETGVIILTGAGRAFCAGLDLKELGDRSPAEATEDRGVARAIAELDRPIIAAINGYCVTGGFELAMMCDLLVASTEARFADTHALVGVVPGWGLSQRLPRMIGIHRAKELSLSGNFLDARQACDWGLLNRVVDPDQLLPTCRALARDLLAADRASSREILRIMDAGWATTLAEGLEIEDRANRLHSRSEVTAEKIAARREIIQARARRQQG